MDLDSVISKPSTGIEGIIDLLIILFFYQGDNILIECCKPGDIGDIIRIEIKFPGQDGQKEGGNNTNAAQKIVKNIADLDLGGIEMKYVIVDPIQENGKFFCSEHKEGQSGEIHESAVFACHDKEHAIQTQLYEGLFVKLFNSAVYGKSNQK